MASHHRGPGLILNQSLCNLCYKTLALDKITSVLTPHHFTNVPYSLIHQWRYIISAWHRHYIMDIETAAQLYDWRYLQFSVHSIPPTINFRQCRLLVWFFLPRVNGLKHNNKMSQTVSWHKVTTIINKNR